MHTNATDGKSSLLEMVQACAARGYEYLAITDHTQALAMTKGMRRAGFEKQSREIEAVQREVPGVTILRGAEVDIREDGRLDLDDETLAELDVVIASVHSKFEMKEREMTERVLRALRHPCVNVVGHPTGRLIGQREPYAIDIGNIVKAARDAHILIELNAQPERLDLNDVHVRMAKDAGVTLVIDTDAHRTSELDLMRYGVGQARRGWCKAADVANTYARDDLLALLRARRRPLTTRAHGHSA
jgi:DNA polymerase (family 10)